VTAEEVQTFIEHVHRSALPMRAAVDAPEPLRHHSAGRDTSSEGLTMVAVRRDDVIIRPEHRQRTRAHGLLADVEVAEPTDLAECICLRAALLESTLQKHRPDRKSTRLNSSHDQISYA